jgi:glycosyltransferase involved in cell wall biosynthesis
MNICLITSTLPPVTGGLETHVWELARGLAGRGHRVSLIGFRNWRGGIFPEQDHREGVAIYREWDTVLPVYYFRYKLFSLRAARRAVRLHRREPFDVIHAHQEYPAGAAGVLAGRLGNIPVVITCHGSSLLLNGETPWLRPVIRWTLRRAGRVLGVGEDLRMLMEKAGGRPDRIDIIPNSVDTARFSPANRGLTVRARFGPARDTIVVAFVGRLHPIKGAGRFLEMIRALRPAFPSARFLIVGKGDLEESLRRRAGEIGAEEAVIFAGEVGHDAVPDYLGASDILVVPSVSEAGGLSCLEGMAAGKAVVAQKVGGLAALLRDGENGLLVDPGNEESVVGAFAAAVGRLIGDPVLRDRLGANARRTAEEHFGQRAYLDRMATLYREATR